MFASATVIAGVLLVLAVGVTLHRLARHPVTADEVTFLQFVHDSSSGPRFDDPASDLGAFGAWTCDVWRRDASGQNSEIGIEGFDAPTARSAKTAVVALCTNQDISREGVPNSDELKARFCDVLKTVVAKTPTPEFGAATSSVPIEGLYGEFRGGDDTPHVDTTPIVKYPCAK